jgi:hypothetical protein
MRRRRIESVPKPVGVRQESEGCAANSAFRDAKSNARRS